MNTVHPKNIGVFFGGQSPEHEISIITGQFVIATLQKMGYTITPVYIDRQGVWYTDEKISELKFFQKNYEKELQKLPPCTLSLSQSQHTLVLQTQKLIGAKDREIDFVFPTFHGSCGEDGSIQGMLELFHIPYAGCGIYSSAVGIDKGLFKKFLQSEGLPTTNFHVFQKKNWQTNREAIQKKILAELPLPVFVKPTQSGSSIGITKVKQKEDLEQALDLAFYYGADVIVEASVENVADLTCSVISDGKTISVSMIQEALFTDDLFDYTVKYLEDGGAQIGNSESNIIIPAEIPEEQTDQIQEYSQRIFESLGCNGMTRIDFLADKKSGELFVNEMNTLPGTLYHHLWEKSGVAIEEVVQQMIAHGSLRHEEQKETHVDFSTEVLEMANGMKLGG